MEAAKCAVNVATLVGHNSVRRLAMHGSWDRVPSPEELDKMKALVDQGMRDGAMGLSTGLIYLPGTFAKPEEIIGLAKVASAHDGIYASHMRAENVRTSGSFFAAGLIRDGLEASGFCSFAEGHEMMPGAVEQRAASDGRSGHAGLGQRRRAGDA